MLIACYIIVFIAIQVSLQATVLEPSVYCGSVCLLNRLQKYMNERN